MTYVLTPAAEAELADAAAYCLTRFGPLAADRFLATFEEKARLLAEFPGLGTSTLNGRRLLPIGRYPFSLLYRVDEGVIRISAIAHHGRGPGYWRNRP